MGKSSEVLKEKLRAAFEAKAPSKMELHRKTGIPRPSIDGYLRGAVPDLDALDAIADAIGTKPWTLIRPEGAEAPLLTAAEPTHREHTLADCKRAVDAALERQMAADAETRAKANAKTGPGAQDVREKQGEEKE